METTQLPSLYSIDSNEIRRVWTVSIKPGCYTVSHGVEGGKLSSHTRTCLAKNVGKSNETSLLEQARSEAYSKWHKKKDAGYYCSTLIELDVEPTDSTGPVLPMLAQCYNIKKLQFPCFVQPKLDGVRAIYRNQSFWSRTGKRIKGLEHIINQLKNQNGVLDGELYSNELSFQKLVAAVKKPNSDTNKVCYVIYDTVLEADFVTRLSVLKSIENHSNVKILETYTCESEQAVEIFHNDFIDSGYEGIILRNNIGFYVQRHRSWNLQKLKKFQDCEFEIVGFLEGKGCESGAILFQCQCSAGVFTVRPAGTREERRKMFKVGRSYIGKHLTVKFQELTDSGIPRFPVGMCIRDYE